MSGIAIVGMACRYPDATSPKELWENSVAGRKAFRRLPSERMNLADYYDADPTVPDKFYAKHAAVIDGYEFDRVKYRIAGSTYRSTDLTHWLALDTAATALADAGFPMGDGLPRERASAIVGNTLTGEFSRANVMRLRWPYVRRTVAAALEAEGWDAERLGDFLDGLEGAYKAPFPGIDEDTLAGGLANTIAGRICNYFDLNGGGYTVDGACSSSLLAVVDSCKQLADGSLDVAIAGGVDLSIDPFEIIGFAKTSALAKREVRIYDRDSNGFWPGEGCGMVVLMREEDAREQGRRVYATIRGWGISSDGKGGMTRPEVRGYRLAMARAYERAGFGSGTVPLFEGHGTGTPEGDKVELTALSQERLESGSPEQAAVSSIKGMIGHAKAAAGVAGLIKATMAVHAEVMPPSLSTVDPHALLADPDGGRAPVRVLRNAEPWPTGKPVRAAITSMGFGGINTHIVVENTTPRRRRGKLDARTRGLAAGKQDVELLLVDAGSTEELREKLTRLAAFTAVLSYAELGDLSATLAAELGDLPHRVAAVVSSPEDAVRRLEQLVELLDAGETSASTPDGRAFLGQAAAEPTIGFLFPGQGSGRGTSGGALRRRFAEVDEVYAKAALPTTGDMVATAVAQPRIVTGSLAGLRALDLLGIDADVAVGHSLGEISALHWAGALDEETALRVAATRGRTMAEHSSSGTMASVAAANGAVAELIGTDPVVIAGYNGPKQTVLAGSVEAVEAVGRRAAERGVGFTRLAVSHAFHSPLVAPAADAFGAKLEEEDFDRPERRVVSTVTGEPLAADTDLRALLHRQITDPVLFAQAVQTAAKDVDLFVEVGPGRVLAGLAAAVTDVPAVALDTDDESLVGLLRVAGAAYVAGVPDVHQALLQGRLIKPLAIGKEFSFFASPAESAPDLRPRGAGRPAGGAADPVITVDSGAGMVPGAAPGTETPAGESTLDLLRRLAAERAELPVEMVGDDSRLLDDLHLSSITVGQLVNQAAGILGVPAAQTPTNFAMATLRELAESLDELAGTAGSVDPHAAAPVVAGAAAWAHPWFVDLDELPRPSRTAPEPAGSWQVFAPGDHFLTGQLRRALERKEVGTGILVHLPPECTRADVQVALAGARTAATAARDTRFVLVQHGRGAAGLAKTLQLEAPQLRVSILQVPAIVEAVEWVADEVAATERFVEAYYDSEGVRRIPTLRAMPVEARRTENALDDTDVLLVTGGGKGITAECALAVATDTGAKLAVLGRSDPADDTELSANLARMADSGITVAYARADVTDPSQVRRAVSELTAALGPVTGVLHGAGRNEPGALTSLDEAAFERTFAPKVDGLQAVLDAVDVDALRLFVAFGSIIGRAGLRGEAHYATANEWLADLTEEVARRNPSCRTLCLEWSVWSGVGMGERLSVVEALTRDGVTPISPDQGVAIMRRLVADPDAPTIVVISGRTEGIDTVRYDLPALPLLRFVERPLIRYHGVELVTEVELSAGADRYLEDHQLDGNLLFPAVFGMEAMAQVAAAVTGWTGTPVIEAPEFLRPIVVPPQGSTTIRVAAVVTGADSVAVAIRSAETDFAADHFTATLTYGRHALAGGPPDQIGEGLPEVPLDPPADLYADTLFQGRRFQRLRTYHRAAAKDVDADLAVLDAPDWFAGFLPGDLLLGDPGMRDALMHGNQVCVPEGTLLPVGVGRVHPGGPRLHESDRLRYSAVERSRDGDTYVYDIAVRTGSGEVVERWDGLVLRAVRKKDGRGPWVPPLLGSYVERSLDDLVGGGVAVAVEPHTGGEPAGVAERRALTATAVGRALGRAVEVRYRPDGRPEVPGGPTVSASHGGGLTLAVAAEGALGCDVEAVTGRTAETWAGLLGGYEPLAALIARETGEDYDTAATRVWSAVECLRKAGLAADVPLAVTPVRRDAWMLVSSGDLRIATLATTLRGGDAVVLAVLTEGRS